MCAITLADDAQRAIDTPYSDRRIPPLARLPDLAGMGVACLSGDDYKRFLVLGVRSFSFVFFYVCTTEKGNEHFFSIYGTAR